MNSYQKQKAKIAQLEKDIHTLVTNGDSRDGLILKMAYQVRYDVAKLLHFGDSTATGDAPKGLLGRLQK